MFLGKKISIRLAHRVARALKPKPPEVRPAVAEKAALRILEINPVRQVVHERAQQELLVLQFLLRAFPLDELPDLAAEGGDQLEHLRVRLDNFMAEKFNHAEKLLAHQNRKTERPVQAGPRRHQCAGKTVVAGHVGDPGRLHPGPDAARQPFARLKSFLPGGRREFRHVQSRPVPELDAVEPLQRRINPPDRPQIPAQAPADGLDDFRRGLGQRLRVRQHPRHRVLDGRAPLQVLPVHDFFLQPVIGVAKSHRQLVGHRQRPRPRRAQGEGDAKQQQADHAAADGHESFRAAGHHGDEGGLAAVTQPPEMLPHPQRVPG